MTVAKAAVLTTALVGAVAIGVAIGPTVRNTWSEKPAPAATTATAPSDEPAAVKPERRAPRASTRTRTTEAPPTAPAKEAGKVETVAVSVWEPELQHRVKAVLNKGANPEIAAADFASAEQFMTVAHAARNTQVPFMVLKDSVLNQGQTLADAIHEYKPELNAQEEVARARAAARADLNIAS
jgi:hypothetical protein